MAVLRDSYTHLRYPLLFEGSQSLTHKHRSACMQISAAGINAHYKTRSRHVQGRYSQKELDYYASKKAVFVTNLPRWLRREQIFDVFSKITGRSVTHFDMPKSSVPIEHNRGFCYMHLRTCFMTEILLCHKYLQIGGNKVHIHPYRDHRAEEVERRLTRRHRILLHQHKSRGIIPTRLVAATSVKLQSSSCSDDPEEYRHKQQWMELSRRSQSNRSTWNSKSTIIESSSQDSNFGYIEEPGIHTVKPNDSIIKEKQRTPAEQSIQANVTTITDTAENRQTVIFQKTSPCQSGSGSCSSNASVLRDKYVVQFSNMEQSAMAYRIQFYDNYITTLNNTMLAKFDGLVNLYMQQLQDHYGMILPTGVTPEDDTERWWEYINNYASRNNFSFEYLVTAIQKKVAEIHKVSKAP